jgi:hypothetical protein
MSSNGTRKPTVSWESPSRGLFRDSSGVVVVDQAPSASSAAITIDSAAIVVEERAVLPPLPKQRPGVSTLETSNNEMAILERPLDGGVASIDENPPRRWRHAAAFIVTAAIVGGGGIFVLSRHRAAVARHVGPSSPAVAPVASPASSAPGAALQPTAPSAAASAGSSQPAAVGGTRASPDDSAADDSEQLRGSQSASRKVTSPSERGHSKHARSASGKSGHHRANRHAGTSKHHSRQE